jgi:hypothetical protein
MPSGVELAVRNQVDNLGAYKAALRLAVTGRNSLWAMVDAAGDQTYENVLKGFSITAVDTSLGNTKFGNQINDWFTLHRDYYTTYAGITGVTDINSALTYYRWRVPQDFNDLYRDWSGNYLTLTNVFPPADLILGTYAKTSSTFTAGTAIDTTKASSARIMANATSLIGGANLTLTATLVKSDSTTTTQSVTISSGSAIGTTATFGQTSLGSNAASGQPTVSVSSTSAFIVGEKVLLSDSSNQEVLTVLSMVTNTSVTFTQNLRNSYTTAASAIVTPLYNGITGCTHSLGTNGDTVNFKIAVDRTISI